MIFVSLSHEVWECLSQWHVSSPWTSCQSFGRIIAKECIELRARRGVGEAAETTVIRDGSCGAHEAAPGRARKRATDTDSSYAKCRDVLQGQFAGQADKQVDRLGRDRGDDCRDLFTGTNSRCVEAVGAGLCI